MVVIATRGSVPPPVPSTDSTGAADVVAAGVPDVAVVSCRGSGAETDTPVVQAQPDGVHLTVFGLAVFHVRDPERADDVGRSLLARGSADIRRHFPPGDLWIGCPGEAGESSGLFHRNWVWVERLVRLTVTD